MDGSLRPKNKLEGTLGKGTESLLLGDGDAPLRFSSIARQAGTVQRQANKPGNPRQRLIYVRFEGALWASRRVAVRQTRRKAVEGREAI